MALDRLKRLLIGSPFTNSRLSQERLPNWKALAVLSSDALSSIAYATEEIFLPLAIVGIAALSYSLPISGAIVALLALVTASYLQLIRAYRNGGGAYVAAKEQLGQSFGLIAGGCLMIDYVLTVAVSVSAGVRALTSAFPIMGDHRIIASLLLLSFLTWMNLRGLRDSSNVFSFPTYTFLASVLILLSVGFYRLWDGTLIFAEVIPSAEIESLSWLILIKSFAAGCTALAGVEAISNAVPEFKEPKAINAQKTLLAMAGILGVSFLGLTYFANGLKILPRVDETMVSQLARMILNDHPIYYFVQISTAAILFLAANTCFNGFPFLAAKLAKDQYVPRQFASMGDRGVFSNAILGLSAASFFLLWMFEADPHLLVPLYAVGIFASFTLAQTSMAFHAYRIRVGRWRGRLAVNVAGAIATLAATCVLSFAKFTDGAWVVFVIVPILVVLMTKIRNHYLEVGSLLKLKSFSAAEILSKPTHTVIVPISGMHEGTLAALQYAKSLSEDVRAVYVEMDPQATEYMLNEWKIWAHEIPLVVLKSPYRSIMAPILSYLDHFNETCHSEFLTVIIPEFVAKKWWHTLLHNQTALLIRTALRLKRGKIVTSVRYHLKAN